MQDFSRCSSLGQGYNLVITQFFPSGPSYSICKTIQERASDTLSVTIVLIINCFFVLSWGRGWGGACRVLLGSSVLQWTSFFISLHRSAWAFIWSVSQSWTAGSKGICILNILYFCHTAPQNSSTIHTSTSTACGFSHSTSSSMFGITHL